MEVQTQVFICMLCMLLVLYTWLKTKSSKFRTPPGPTPLPVIGNLLQIGSKPHLSFLKMGEKYGPIFKIKMGNLDAVILNDHKLIKELFSDNSSTGRLGENPATYEFSRGPYGVINSEGKTWEEQRRFTIKTLRNLGFAKTSMETMIIDEVYSMLKWFDSANGSPIEGTRIFQAPIMNILWHIISGERCAWDEGKPLVLEYAEKWCDSMARIATSGIYFEPLLRFIAPEYLGWNKYVQMCCKMHEIFGENIATHKTSFDPSNLRGFIDHHLKEVSFTKDHESSFHSRVAEKNLAATMVDLFVAGSETISNTLSYALLYLSNFPQIQNRLRQEIDNVIGSTAAPSLANRVLMPYTEATIAEILRMSSTACLGLAHCMLKSKDFHGYYLPKGMAVFANIYAVHHKKDIWGDPQNFRPERFLDETGTKYVKNEALIPFSEGKRKCIGETMARDSLFLFVTSIFQKFTVLPRNIGDKPELEPRLGYLLEAKPFQVRMVRRIENSNLE